MLIPISTSALLLCLLIAAARKWELKTRHYLPWSLAMAVLGGTLTYIASSTFPDVPALLFALPAIVVAAIASICAIMFFFFRDPERDPPGRQDLIVSPADGTVVYIEQIEDGMFPFAVKNNREIPLTEFAREDLIPAGGIQIGIAMNYLNVHVNRSPIAGIVRMVKAVPGKFSSLKNIQALLENERALMVFENDNLKIGIVQISSRLVRRIVPYVQEGQVVAQGDRVGMIKFGSQVDLLIPYREDLDIQVAVGEEVTAGESVLVSVQNLAPSPRSSSPRHQRGTIAA